MGIRTSIVLAAAVTTAAAAAGAQAAAPWSDPRALGPAEGIVLQPTIEFAADGATLVSRRTNRSRPSQPPVDSDRLATLMPDGRLVEHGALRDLLAAPPVVYGRGRVALLRETVLSRPSVSPRRLPLSLSTGSVTKPVRRRRPQTRRHVHALPQRCSHRAGDGRWAARRNRRRVDGVQR